jgi:hypothetical protein
MSEFARQTFTRQKFQRLFINTALGNFVGYIAGSLVTLFTTYRTIERRALKNLFGVLPRKQVVVHVLPDWLEWVLAVLVGFLVMEFVRYWFNYHKYAELDGSQRHEPTLSAPGNGASARPLE